MKRPKLTIIFIVIVAMILATMVFSGCKVAATETTTAETTGQATTSQETTASESATTQKTWSLEEAAKPYAGTVLHTTLEPWAAGEAYKPIIEDFTALTGIKIEVEMLEVSEAEAKMMADFQAETHNYDFFGVIPENLMKWKTIGLLAPMEKYLSNEALRDPSFSLDNIPPVIKETFTLNNELFAFPNYVVQSCGIYRKDIAENPEEKAAFKTKYGYDLTFPIDTPQKYLDVCQFFNRKAGEKLAGQILKENFYGTTVAYKRGWWTTANYIKFEVPFGGRAYDKTGNVTFNTPANLEALKFMLALRPYCPPGYLEATWDEQVGQYILGNVFMYDSWTDTFPYIEDATQSKVAGLNGYFRPDVWGEGGRAAEGVFKGIAVLEGSKNKEAAYLFIQYIQSPEVQKKYQLQGGTSSNLTVLKDPEIYDKTPYIPTIVEMLQDPTALEPVVGWPWLWESYELFSNEINMTAADQKTPENALIDIQKAAEDIAKG